MNSSQKQIPCPDRYTQLLTWTRTTEWDYPMNTLHFMLRFLVGWRMGWWGPTYTRLQTCWVCFTIGNARTQRKALWGQWHGWIWRISRIPSSQYWYESKYTYNILSWNWLWIGMHRIIPSGKFPYKCKQFQQLSRAADCRRDFVATSSNQTVSLQKRECRIYG